MEQLNENSIKSLLLQLEHARLEEEDRTEEDDEDTVEHGFPNETPPAEISWDGGSNLTLKIFKGNLDNSSLWNLLDTHKFQFLEETEKWINYIYTLHFDKDPSEFSYLFKEEDTFYVFKITVENSF